MSDPFYRVIGFDEDCNVIGVDNFFAETSEEKDRGVREFLEANPSCDHIELSRVVEIRQLFFPEDDQDQEN